MERKSCNEGEVVPEEIQIEILVRMPLKPLVRFTCVSKKWESIIKEKRFKDRYLLRSMTKPQVLLMIDPLDPRAFHQPTKTYTYFQSFYQDEKASLLSSSGQQQIRYSSEPQYEVTQPIQGLICLYSDTKVLICNPSTSRKFLTLPEIKPLEDKIEYCFFGYDEVTDVFKVLCMTQLDAKEDKVLTVRLGEKESWSSWRPITCNLHYPTGNESLCKRGVLYYGASWLDSNVVMSFNVRSEESSVIELPEEVNVNNGWKLVNYRDELALMNYNNGEVQIWVRNETVGEWRKENIVIPHWRENIGDHRFTFKGVTATGELAFAQDQLLFTHTFCGCYYNIVTEKFRMFRVKPVARGGSDNLVHTFLNHVDNLLLI